MSNTTKDCMFQYATQPKWGDVRIDEDTDLITLDEAKTLWRKYLPKFIEEHEQGDSPEMVIWVDCEDNATYGKSLAHIDASHEVKNGKVYQVSRTEVTVEESNNE